MRKEVSNVFNIHQFITTKKEGNNHLKGDITTFIEKFMTHEVTDNQMSAWLMAVSIEGLSFKELVELTEEVIPEGRRNAFIAAQKASLKHKISRAQIIIASSAATAIAAGATPIPFSDALLLVPIEIGMLAGISKVFGLTVSKGLLGTLVSSMLGTSAATLGGKAIVSGLLKLIPGVGTVVGATISGATAGTLTTVLGEIYVGTLTTLFSASNGEPPTAEDIEKEFKMHLNKNRK